MFRYSVPISSTDTILLTGNINSYWLNGGGGDGCECDGCEGGDCSGC